ncbi:MAG TPA: long-chain fatty acid--CoA ligase, partial [bacterium]|nr:long-chain fatty acid--CoA ligase [bacterium]
MAPDLSLIHLFLAQVQKNPEAIALSYLDAGRGKFTGISRKQLLASVEKAALGLHNLGVRRGDRVGILAENRPEWVIADLAILSLGAVVVPIYPTSSVEETHFLMENAGSDVLFLSTPGQFSRLAQLFSPGCRIRKIILFDLPASPVDSRVMGFTELLEAGRLEKLNSENGYRNFVDSLKPDDLATLIYTSGTTGPPKGVMLTHRNFLENAAGAFEFIKISESDCSISFLPLSHVFERLAGYYFMLAHGATIAYAQNMQTVVGDMREIRPTLACAVPRFYEKFHARVIEKVARASPVQKKIFYWALAVGKSRLETKSKKMPLLLSLKVALARLLVFKKIKSQLGGRMRFFISGGAPLSRELAEFFYALDILILEGYGLTETSPVITVNSPDHFCFGTVGRPLRNVEVRIAEDGEILTRGPCVMQGYYQNPEATREVIRDGWFHTGDVGCFTAGGFLKITDRKKDIIKTSGGKMISPQNIEGMILADPLFSQAIVIGDKRNYLVALLVPNRTEVETRAREMGISCSSPEEMLRHPKIQEWIETRFRERTRGLAPFEQIKYYALLSEELTLAAGEITPTLKVKRKVVCEKFKDIIEELYR